LAACSIASATVYDRVTTDNSVGDKTAMMDALAEIDSLCVTCSKRAVCRCTLIMKRLTNGTWSPTKCFYLCASHGGKAGIVSAPFVHVPVCAHAFAHKRKVTD